MADYSWIVITSVIAFIAGTLAGLLLSKVRPDIKKGSLDDELKNVENIINSIKNILKISSEPENYGNNQHGNKVKVYRSKKKIHLLMKISSDLRLVLNKLVDLNSRRTNKLTGTSQTSEIQKEANKTDTVQTVKSTRHDFYDDFDDDDDFESNNVPSSSFNYNYGYSQTREPTEEPYRRIDVPQSLSPTNEFIRQYNQACVDRRERQLFWENYKNFTHFGNKNAAAQARGEDTDFDFRTKDGGDFIAVKLPNDDRYFVVPQFDTTINNTTYKEGGFGVVFECLNYQPGYSYSSIKVEEPAVFKQTGDQWTLINPGKMFLKA